MKSKSRRTFSPEFRLESAQLVVDQQYSIREAALAVGVGHSTMDKWVRQLRNERQGVTPKQSAMTWTSHANKDTLPVHFEAFSNASGLTPPR
jgi:transposase